MWADTGLSFACRVGADQILGNLGHFVLGDIWSYVVQIGIFIGLW